LLNVSFNLRSVQIFPANTNSMKPERSRIFRVWSDSLKLWIKFNYSTVPLEIKKPITSWNSIMIHILICGFSHEVAVTNPRYSLLEDGTLMIANTVLDDVGVYECVAKNTAGQSKSRSAVMRVGRTVGKHPSRSQAACVFLSLICLRKLVYLKMLFYLCAHSFFPSKAKVFAQPWRLLRTPRAAHKSPLHSHRSALSSGDLVQR